MAREIDVYIQLGADTAKVGLLWLRASRGRESCSFEYDRQWLSRPNNFSLDPALPLSRGVFHTQARQGVFGCLMDCSPDRWGRTLITREEVVVARRENRAPRTVLEGDFLLRVNDTVRQGALRFSEAGSSHFLASTAPGVPPQLSLGALLQASLRVGSNNESEQDLQLLLQPGSSLGGARPKAAILDAQGQLCIAKFPKEQDQWDIPLWEYISLRLAALAGIETPRCFLQSIGGKHVLLVQRFDRTATGERIPFVSAMTLLGAVDGEQRSYVEIAEILRAYGAQPQKDMAALWRRMVFNICTSNMDDHLRNHGFLREDKGWRLSPVYDLESMPPTHKIRMHSTYITLYDATSSLDLAREVAEEFGLQKQQAEDVIMEVRTAVGHWRDLARQVGVTAADMTLMAAAMEQG